MVIGRRAVLAGMAVAIPSVPMASSAAGQVEEGFAALYHRRLAGTMRFLAGENRERALLFLADPRCGFCHRAWAVMRPYVARGEFAVDVMLIGVIRGSEEIAVSVLSQADPGAAWMAGQASTPRAVVPPPPPRHSPEYQRARDGLLANLNFARQMGLQGTPWTAFTYGEDLYHLIGAGDVEGFVRRFLSLV